MAKYRFSKELEGKTLELGDMLSMANLNYQVRGNFLSNLESCYNGQVFDRLEISDKEHFCQKYYGYVPSSGDFPETNSDDKENYQALTRIAIALMRLSEFKIVKDALDECACIKEHIKTPSLVPMAEELEKLLEGKDPNSNLDQREIKMVRELFNAAEDQIHKKVI